MGGISMNELNFLDAISNITNGAGFKISGTDLDTLEILDGSPKPTLKEIETKMAEMLDIRTQQITQKANEKAALLLKLGINEDEARLLLS